MILYPDKKIVEDIKSGDERLNNKALTYLYKEFLAMASDIIKKRGGNSHWVQEIFQEAIITLYESIKEDKFCQKSSIKTYLYSIIRNKWLSTTQKTQYFESLTGVHGSGDTLFFLPENDDEMVKNNLVKNVIDQLGDPCKQLLNYYYYERLSMKQITLKMNYSNEQSTKTQKFKCLQRFIEYIENRSNVKHTLNELL